MDIADVLYTVMYNKGAYYGECNKLLDKSKGDKTLDHFQTFLQYAQMKIRKKS